jgi:hypothetical protein
MDGEWKPIDDFPGYFINKLGQIKKEIFIMPQVKNNGYAEVVLWKDGKKHYKLFHRLLGQAFIPNPENKSSIDHINRDKQDNRLENLRWATASENMVNKGVMVTNKLQEKNICIIDNRYYVRIVRNKMKICDKSFKTLEEAIVFRDNLLGTLA